MSSSSIINLTITVPLSLSDIIAIQNAAGARIPASNTITAAASKATREAIADTTYVLITNNDFQTKPLTLTLKIRNGKTVALYAAPSTTVQQVQDMIASREGIAVEKQQILWSGQEISSSGEKYGTNNGERTLEEIGISEECQFKTLHVIAK